MCRLDDRDLPILEESIGKIWDKAREMGLDPYPTHFEIVPASILYEFGAYLLPGRFSHWTHGKAYYTMKASYDYGLSKIYELVINANPSYAFLLDTNSLLHNKFVVAHVFGHTDFFKHNIWFEPTNRQMIETVSQNAQRIRQYSMDEGSLEVEKFLDAVLSISDHIDPYPRREASESRPTRSGPSPSDEAWNDLFPATGAASSLAMGKAERNRTPHQRRRIPAEPERDVLRFLLEHADGLEDWQRDIIAIVREESLYFVPQMQTNGSVGTSWRRENTHLPEAAPGGVCSTARTFRLEQLGQLLQDLCLIRRQGLVRLSLHLVDEGLDLPGLGLGIPLCLRLFGRNQLVAQALGNIRVRGDLTGQGAQAVVSVLDIEAG